MSTETTVYDSRLDTLAHIARVRELLENCTARLTFRGAAHDASKLVDPEKATFDACTTKLKAMAYGSPEYKAALAELKPALDHHYAANSHHPEHYRNGVDGMSLFDVLEMLMDWKAATERMNDGGDIWHSLQINADRFRLSPQLLSIIENTVREMGWPKKPVAAGCHRRGKDGAAMSDTPRTDAHTRQLIEILQHPHWIQFARKLERENAALREERDSYRFRSEQVWGLRKEIQTALGVPDECKGEEALKRGLETINKMRAAIDAARKEGAS